MREINETKIDRAIEKQKKKIKSSSVMRYIVRLQEIER
jgi:hypothetical protein